MPAIARSEPFRNQTCPLAVCDGSGWILDDKDQALECKCRQARLQRGRSRGVASAIPARYRGVSFDRPPVSDMAHDVTTSHVVKAVRAYVNSLSENLAAGRGLWLMGTTGTGKTTLGMLIAKEALAADKTVGIYFTTTLLNRIRQTYQAAESNGAYDDFFRRVTSVDLLYIDDLGSERHTDWVVEQLYALVNERYERGLPMLITSNSDSEVDQDADHGLRQLNEQIGPRTVSRLVEICGDPLPLFGPDRRVQAQAIRG